MGAKSKAKAKSDATLILQGALPDELTAYCPDLEQWPRSWMYEERDLSHGQQMVECFKPFLRHLLSAGPSRKTLRSHRDNSSRNCMRTLGSESGRQTRSCSRSSTTKADRSSPQRIRRSAALFRLDLPKVLSLSQRAQHGRSIGSQAMDMWTTQERCPHAHSLKQQIQKANQG